jgi:threonine dehydratase
VKAQVTFEDILAARKTIEGQVSNTPCLPSRTLSQLTGADVWVKFENLQFTASFKERGALTKLVSLSELERAAGVVAASAGNHAQAVAYHAQRLGIRATIVMPRHTPNAKVDQTRVFGPEVILYGAIYDEAEAHAHEIAREQRAIFVHPFDDPHVIAGQGTVALEMLETEPGLDTLVVPVGGGGLISGIALAAKHVNPAIGIVGVESARFPAMHAALRGEPAEFGATTIAEGIAVKAPGKLTREIAAQCVDAIVLVEEEELEQAVVMFLEIEKSVAEGAGAAGLAALLKEPERFAGKRVGLVLSGGNIDLMMLSSVIQRGLVRSRRLVRVIIELPDLPGTLGQVCARLGELDCNIVDLRHQRTFGGSSVRAAEVEFLLQMRGEAQTERVIQALAEQGYAVRKTS